MDSAGHIQNVENEADQVIGSCLRNPVVLSIIFEKFSSTELLKLSLVNKLWNYEARSLMKKRGNVIASFASDEPCPLLHSFVSIVSGMSIVPFSGMKFSINICSHDYGAPDPIIIPDEILDRISWTHFSVEIGGQWCQHKLCPALLHAKRVLQKYGGVLEELTLDLPRKGEQFIQEALEEFCLPRLKILKFGAHYDLLDVDEPHEVDTDYMKALVSRAPNLQELHSQGLPNLQLSLMEVSSAVLVCSAVVFAPFDDVFEGAMSALRLKRMELEYTGPEFNFERFNRITPMLLQASCTKTLCSLRVDAVLAVAFMSYGICLENVKDFTLVMNDDDWDPVEQRICRLVKCLDFTRMLPNVSRVTVLPCQDFGIPQPHPDHVNAIIDQARALCQKPALLDRAVNIKAVDFRQSTFSISTVQFYAEMFPNIQKLHASVDGGEAIPFGSIWKNWSDLKQLVVMQDLRQIWNLDSVFCGIFPEEVAELREKDEDYLLRVNIVPVMPAITCLRNLRTFGFNFYFQHYVTIDDPTLIFSKVTVLTAFARVPNLDLAFNFPVENLERALLTREAIMAALWSPKFTF